MEKKPAVQHQVVHHADSNTVNNLLAIREKIKDATGKCGNKPVNIQTLDGYAYEGHIVEVRGCYLYLRVNVPHGYAHNQRFFSPFFPYGYYNYAILPLVLYDLLTITLLYP